MAAPMATVAVPTDAELLQAQADLWRHSLCYLTSMSLQCAIKLGIPAAIHRLGGATTLPDLVTALSLPPAKLPFLRRLMRLLVTEDVFAFVGSSTTEERVYKLTPLSCLLLDGASVADDDGHASQAPFVIGATSRHYLEASMELSDWFRKDVGTASPFELVHGATLFHETLASAHPEFDKEINEALAAHDNLGIGTILRECRGLLEGLQSLTYCCGGDRTMANAIVKALPHVKCTVLDLPRVTHTVSPDGVVDHVAGDVIEFVVPPSQAVMLKLVLHHWSDEDCVKILAQCKKAIPARQAGGKVIIIDILVESCSGKLLEAQLLMDVAMMVMTKGRQRDENDWRDIFMKAGFTDYKIVKKLGARGVFEVYP